MDRMEIQFPQRFDFSAPSEATETFGFGCFLIEAQPCSSEDHPEDGRPGHVDHTALPTHASLASSSLYGHAQDSSNAIQR